MKDKQVVGIEFIIIFTIDLMLNNDIDIYNYIPNVLINSSRIKETETESEEEDIIIHRKYSGLVNIEELLLLADEFDIYEGYGTSLTEHGLTDAVIWINEHGLLEGLDIRMNVSPKIDSNNIQVKKGYDIQPSRTINKYFDRWYDLLENLDTLQNFAMYSDDKDKMKEKYPRLYKRYGDLIYDNRIVLILNQMNIE